MNVGTANTGVQARRGLAARRARFVVEYLIDLNATQAAIRAGYSPNGATVQGTRLLADASIQAAIQKARETRLVRTEITQDRVLSELALLAFSDVTHYDVDENGNVTAAEGAPPGAMRAVSSIKRKVRVDKDGNIEREVELKLWDKPGPLRLAGRHVGLFPAKDKQQLQDEAKAMVDAMIAEAKARKQAIPAPVEGRMIDVGTDE